MSAVAHADSSVGYPRSHATTEMQVYDPYVPSLATKAGVFASAGSVEEAFSRAECAVFLVDHDVFRGVSVEAVKELMASPGIVGGKNLFAGGEGIRKGTDWEPFGSQLYHLAPGIKGY